MFNNSNNNTFTLITSRYTQTNAQIHQIRKGHSLPCFGLKIELWTTCFELLGQERRQVGTPIIVRTFVHIYI